MNVGTLYGLGVVLLFVGVVVLVVAVVLFSLSASRGSGKVRGGGAVIIGPVPIVFGSDKKSLQTALVLAIVLTVLLIILAVVFYLTSERAI